MKEQVANIVAAYLKRNQVLVTELPGLITSVNQAFGNLGQAPTAAVSPLPTPAVPIRRSVGAEAITCLDCGFKAKILKRHLSTAHGLTVDQYRTRWGLPSDYPLVARNYSARRSALAREAGLGKGNRGRHTANPGQLSARDR